MIFWTWDIKNQEKGPETGCFGPEEFRVDSGPTSAFFLVPKPPIRLDSYPEAGLAVLALIAIFRDGSVKRATVTITDYGELRLGLGAKPELQGGKERHALGRGLASHLIAGRLGG